MRLSSTYDAAGNSISLDLHNDDEALPAGFRLALTSIVQLTPSEVSSARLRHRLATYHELIPEPAHALLHNATWTVAELAAGHRPRHANDGPVSAFVILPDGTTRPVTVESMRRAGDEDEPTPAAAAERQPDVPKLVPYPAAVDVADPTPSGQPTASLEAGPHAAMEAWDAIGALEQRVDGTATLVASGGLRVAATIDAGMADEAYRLVFEDDRVDVVASGDTGLRHAFVTLARWLRGGTPSRATVDDRPRFGWRGLHIDLARRWFEPRIVERMIDVAAWRKLSRLHLHLTDDEAWRLPVDRHPDLAAVGARRGHGLPIPPMLGDDAGPTGRAYTADEIGRWVERADELGVVLVPEIDVPGHAHAALTSLPWLRDPDDDSGARSVQFFVDNVLVPGHPRTEGFLVDVFEALAALFPSSPWLHIGGDEVPEGAWEGSPIVDGYRSEHALATTRAAEAAFHRELVAMIRDRTARRVGAWQEAAESGGVRPGDGYVVGWRTAAASRELAAAGHDVVVAPGEAYYLDMAVDDEWSSVGGSWAGSTSLRDVCEFAPDADWSDAERAHLLGIQACLWAEHVTDEDALDHLLFPRLDAIAERAWTGAIVGGASSLRARAG